MMFTHNLKHCLFGITLVVFAIAVAGCVSQSTQSSQTPSASATPLTLSPGVQNQLYDIIADQLGINRSAIVPTASLKGDLAADDLDMVELIMRLDNTFGISISDQALVGKLLQAGDPYPNTLKVSDFERVISEAIAAKP